MLEIKHISKQYENGKGITDFCLTIDQKDIVLLLGPNGAGKTTIIRGLLNLNKPSKREIIFEGEPTKDNEEKFIRNVGAVVSSPNSYEYMTGYDNLKVYSAFYDRVNEDRIREVLEIVVLKDEAFLKVKHYSTGMKQRLDFARALLQNPKLLILDEPFSGIDIEQKIQLKKYVKEKVEEDRGAVLISSHMPGDLERFANKVVVVYDARVLYEGKMAAVLEEYETLETFYINIIERYKSA